MTVGQLAVGIFVSEAILAKGLSPIDQCRAVENKLNKLLYSTFSKVLKPALAKAVGILSEGEGPVREGAARDAVATIQAALRGWSSPLAPVVRAATAEAYRIGKVYAYKRAQGLMSRDEFAGYAEVKKAKWGQIPIPSAPPPNANAVWMPNGIGTFSWKQPEDAPNPKSTGGKLWQKVQDANAVIDADTWHTGGSKDGMWGFMTQHEAPWTPGPGPTPKVGSIYVFNEPPPKPPKVKLEVPSATATPPAGPTATPLTSPAAPVLTFEQKQALHQFYMQIKEAEETGKHVFGSNVLSSMVDEKKITQQLEAHIQSMVWDKHGDKLGYEKWAAALSELGVDKPPTLPGVVPPAPPAPPGKSGKGGPAKGSKTAEIKPSFELADGKAIDSMTKHQMLWIGNYSGEKLTQAVDNAAKSTILANGWDRKVAGQALGKELSIKFGFDQATGESPSGLLKVPSGWQGDVPSYLEMVSGNAATVARNAGAIQSFTELSITTYEVVNPSDERTCPFCGWMNGKTFQTKQAMAQLTSEIDATSPDQVKALHPWYHSEKEAISASGASATAGQVSAADSSKLAAAGMSFPPYHGHCRCAVDISESSELVLDPVTIAVAPPPPPPPPPAPPPIATAPAESIIPLPSTPPPSDPAPPPGESLPTAFPWPTNQLKEVNMKLAGIQTGKIVYQSPDGEKWMYKPQLDFRAMTDRLAGEFARALGRETAEVYQWGDGKPRAHTGSKAGSIQKMFKGVTGDLNNLAPTALSGKDAREIQREHIFDWFIAQHDTKGENILRLADGSLKFIDKTQGFRFIGKDRLDMTYGKAGEPWPTPTYYNTMFNAYAKGQSVQLGSFAEMTGMIKSIEGMDEALYIAKMRAYAKSAKMEAERHWEDLKSSWWMGKYSEQQFVDFMVARKRSIRDDVHKFYTELEQQRAKATGQAFKAFDKYGHPVAGIEAPKPGKAPAPPPETPGTGHDWRNIARNARDAKWEGASFYVGGNHYEGMNWLLYGTEGDGTFMEAKLRTPAAALLDKLCTGKSGQVPTMADPFYDQTVDITKMLHFYKKGTYKAGSPILANKEKTAAELFKLLQTTVTNETGAKKLQAQHYLDHLTKVIDPTKLVPKASPLAPANDPWLPSGMSARIEKFVPPVEKPKKVDGLPDGFSINKVTSFEPINRVIDSGNIKALPGTYNHKLKGYTDNLVYEIKTPEGDTILYRPHEKNAFASQGTIRYWSNKPLAEHTPEELERKFKNLEALGLSTKKAEPKDYELVYLRKVVFKEKLNAGNIPESSPRDEQIEKLKTLITGAKPDIKFPSGYKYMPEQEPGFKGGTGKWQAHYIPESVTSQYNTYLGTYNGTATDLDRILGGKTNAFLSNLDRVRAGIPAGGQSPEEDTRTGGANYVFTRLGLAKRNETGLYFKGTVLKDLDAVLYNYDAYGNTQPDNLIKRKTQSDWASLAGGMNEIVFKNSVSLERLEKIVVTNPTEREEVLAVFKKHGVSQMGGKSVGDLVVSRR